MCRPIEKAVIAANFATNFVSGGGGGGGGWGCNVGLLSEIVFIRHQTAQYLQSQG